MIKVSKTGPWFDIGTAFPGINPDRFHVRQIDHQTTIANRIPGNIMPAAAHRQKQVMLPGQIDRTDHVADTGATDNHAGSSIDHSIPDLADFIIGRVRRQDHVTPDLCRKIRDQIVG